MNNSFTVSVTDFKAHCLEYIQRANDSGIEYIITKRHIPVAKLTSCGEKKGNSFVFGGLKETFVIKGDIMEGIPLDWEENL